EYEEHYDYDEYDDEGEADQYEQHEVAYHEESYAAESYEPVGYDSRDGEPTLGQLLTWFGLTVLGITLVCARLLFDFDVRAMIAGFICLGIGAPLLLLFAGSFVAGPARGLVIGLGVAIPGISTIAISIVWRYSIGLTTQ